LAKEKTSAHIEVPSTTALSGVETIVAALSQLENDIDDQYVHVEEMKKRIMAHSNDEIEKLKQQITTLANEEAKKIIDNAKAEANAEFDKIAELGRANVAGIKKNINSSFDRAVDSIVRTVLGEMPASTTIVSPKSEAKEAKSTPQPAKIKKYTSEGKPVAS
jgi:V/A-type H+/Na+-transporting ATPase subunit G/H